MKWRLFNTPEFMKLITSRSIVGVDKNYYKFEYGMYEFTEWVGIKLDQIHMKDGLFTVGKEYELKLMKRDRVLPLLDYASFYINMCNDGLTGKCSYEEILRAIPQHKDRELWLDAHNMRKRISRETFTFVDKPVTAEDDYSSVAFIISKTHKGKLSTDTKLDASISIQIVGYTE